MEDNDVGNDTHHVTLCFKKALKKGLENGRIKTVRETGKGAGSFKLNREHEDNVVKKATKVKKVVAKDDQKKVLKKRDGKSSKVSKTSSSKKAKPTAGKKVVKTASSSKKSSKAPKKTAKKIVKEVKKPAAKLCFVDMSSSS